MRRAFAAVADVVAAAETVWNTMSDQLQQVAADLGAARQQAGGIADDALGRRARAGRDRPGASCVTR